MTSDATLAEIWQFVMLALIGIVPAMAGGYARWIPISLSQRQYGRQWDSLGITSI